MQLRFLHSVFRNSSQVPLCVVLVVPFLLQIVAVMGLIGYFSLRNSRRNLDEITALLRNEVTTRIQQHTAVYLQTPETVIRLNINAIRSGRLNLQNSIDPERYLWQQMQIFPSLSPIAIGNERGEIHAVDRLGDGSLVIRVLDRSTGGEYHTYTTDRQGNRDQLIRVSNQFDPRVRPWYTAALKAGKPTWTEVYPYFSSPGLAISAAQPFYDEKTNKLLGVTNATLSLAEVSDFLRRLEISRSGQTFIMERSGNLVASSTGEQLFTVTQNGQTKTRQRLPAIASRHVLTRQTAQFLSNHFGSFNSITQSQLLDFKLDGRRQLVQVAPFRDRHGLDWLIVVVLPEAELMEHIRANTQATIVLCFVALVLASIFGFLTARWIAQPIRQLGQASQAIASGELQQTIEPQGIRELNDLAQSYNQMAAQLKASFVALETAKEQLEFRVEQRTQQHEEAQKIAHVGNWEFDVATKQITWSTEVFRIFGRDPKTSIPTYEEFLQYIHPDDREHFAELVTRARQAGEPYELDVRIVQTNGLIRDAFVKGQPILDESGQVMKLFGTVVVEHSNGQERREAL
jgi:HAMP domain-containing protein